MSEQAITTYKPCELAKVMGIGKEKVYALIEHGDLVAEDWSTPGSSRPRYRITPEAFQKFRESRQTTGTSSRQQVVPRKKARRHV